MKKTLPGGTLPTREEFEAAFEKEMKGHPHFPFSNDPRVGTCALTCSELWAELTKACAEVEASEDPRVWEACGQWCSDVLSLLGFEWV